MRGCEVHMCCRRKAIATEIRPASPCEYLRFTRCEIKEIAYVLQIPSSFCYSIKHTAYDALALVLFRLSAPLRLKDAVERFNRDLGGRASIFLLIEKCGAGRKGIHNYSQLLIRIP